MTPTHVTVPPEAIEPHATIPWSRRAILLTAALRAPRCSPPAAAGALPPAPVRWPQASRPWRSGSRAARASTACRASRTRLRPTTTVSRWAISLPRARWSPHRPSGARTTPAGSPVARPRHRPSRRGARAAHAHVREVHTRPRRAGLSRPNHQGSADTADDRHRRHRPPGTGCACRGQGMSARSRWDHHRPTSPAGHHRRTMNTQTNQRLPLRERHPERSLSLPPGEHQQPGVDRHLRVRSTTKEKRTWRVCCRMPLVIAVRRRRCLAITEGELRETRRSATRPIPRRLRRSSRSCAPLATEPTALACAR